MPILHDDAHLFNPVGVVRRDVDLVHGLARNCHGKLEASDKIFL